MRFWNNIKRNVGRVLRELGVPEDHISAHDWSKANRQTLMDSNLCGCFCCLDVFLSSEIEEWIENETSEIEEGITDDTAFCPNCGIDSVIGSVSGYPIDRESLKKMHDYWFSPRPRFSTRHFLSL
jgi:hypothetical protein